MTGGTDRLPKAMRLRTGPGRSGYIVAAALWLGGWLGLFGYGHAVWRASSTADLGSPVPLACLAAIAAGVVVWLVVNRLRAGAQKRLLAEGGR